MEWLYGIAIRNVSVRTEPTSEPARKYPGDVWDRRQESRLNIGEPLRLRRLEDGWCYGRTEATEGYLREDGIFECSKRYYNRYLEELRREFRIVVKAGRQKDGQYLRVGTILPGAQKEERCIFTAGMPVFVRSYLPFTERQMRLQMERMVGTPYSWGDERADGMDCSSTVRAFFACFGLSLPRNAEEQKKYGEQLAQRERKMENITPGDKEQQETRWGACYENLAGMSSEEKLKRIAALGMGTVLHAPGHVMIYAGESGEEPRIFHNCDTYQIGDKEYILRKCVISGFLPKGEETYLDRVTAAWKPQVYAA